jgi:hypothetical protein
MHTCTHTHRHRRSLTLCPGYLDAFYLTAPPSADVGAGGTGQLSWAQLEAQASAQPGFVRFTSPDLHVRAFSSTAILFKVCAAPWCVCARVLVLAAACTALRFWSDSHERTCHPPPHAAHDASPKQPSHTTPPQVAKQPGSGWQGAQDVLLRAAELWMRWYLAAAAAAGAGAGAAGAPGEQQQAAAATATTGAQPPGTTAAAEFVSDDPGVAARSWAWRRFPRRCVLRRSRCAAAGVCCALRVETMATSRLCVVSCLAACVLCPACKQAACVLCPACRDDGNKLRLSDCSARGLEAGGRMMQRVRARVCMCVFVCVCVCV